MNENPGRPAVDYDRARAMCNGNEGLLQKLLAHFSTHIPKELSALESHIGRGESDPARDVAHRIKGQAASLAIEGVQEAALRIEEDARDGRMDAAGEDLDALKTHVEAFQRELEERSA